MSLPDILVTLQSRGWSLLPSDGSKDVCFSGNLNTRHGKMPCRIYITDSSLITYPLIVLDKRPKWLPISVPHLNATNSVCYAANGSLVLDPDRAGESVLYCITQAEEVLNQTFSGQNRNDFADEFMIYWGVAKAYVDLPENEKVLSRIKAFIQPFNQDDSPFYIALGKDYASVRKKLSEERFSLKEVETPVIVVDSKKRLGAIEGIWPPNNVASLLAWLSKVDPHCAGDAKRMIEGYSLKSGFCVLAIRAERAWPVALICYPKTLPDNLKEHLKPNVKLGLKRRRQAILTSWVNSSKVFTFAAERIDAAFIATRNIPDQKTLVGKKIALLGCGTIGGYLADLLVRSGAGSDGGELTLVDQDILTSANLGRHILALPFLGENKAVGMARKIQNDFPDTQVKPLPVDLRKAYLGETDLIIDATGSEAISLWISRKYSDKKHFIPKLHVWVEGAGTAIKGLMHDRPEAGCYVCFRQGLRDATNLGLSSLKDPNALIHQYDGCDSLFVPFPASVSMEAAALASKMVTDWVNGILGARLRARVIDNTAGREINEQDILHQPGCGLIV